RILDKIRGNAPGAMAASKDLIYAVTGRPIEQEVITETAHRIATRRSTDEAKEGIGAFLEKRKASWNNS
ncbi:MAG: enoyl-CoA hydratase/isomerase family protein, partial [Sneathiella sp.]